jgi:hypothetical protein
MKRYVRFEESLSDKEKKYLDNLRAKMKKQLDGSTTDFAMDFIHNYCVKNKRKLRSLGDDLRDDVQIAYNYLAYGLDRSFIDRGNVFNQDGFFNLKK